MAKHSTIPLGYREGKKNIILRIRFLLDSRIELRYYSSFKRMRKFKVLRKHFIKTVHCIESEIHDDRLHV